MNQRAFRIGDRVQITSTYDGWTNCGKVGQICYIDFSTQPCIVGVSFKNWDRGHDCAGELKGKKCGWNYYGTQLVLTNEALTDFAKN